MRPKSPGDYKVELPSTFKAPEGLEFKFKEDDPLMVNARAWAHKRGIDQDTFSEGLELFAASQIGTAQMIKQAREAELTKLGATGPQVIDGVMGWLKSMIGDDGAKAISSMMVTADIVNALAKIVTKFGTQGASSYSNGGRDGARNTISDEDWAKMSWNEKRDYQRNFQANGQARR
jgi:hypothetical protein